MRSSDLDTPNWGNVVQAGVVGGLVGGVVIWIYEALVWVHVQHLMPLAGIPPNATGLVFGKHFQQAIGVGAYFLGTCIHFFFAVVWGIVFAAVWPWFRRRGVEATLLALFLGMIAWIVMHVAISIATPEHPNYRDPYVIIGGFMSHFFFAVPMALVVKALLHPARVAGRTPAAAATADGRRVGPVPIGKMP